MISYPTVRVQKADDDCLLHFFLISNEVIVSFMNNICPTSYFNYTDEMIELVLVLHLHVPSLISFNCSFFVPSFGVVLMWVLLWLSDL
jgi:hypothetical protein